jgi:phosphatidylglycerophosphatase A
VARLIASFFGSGLILRAVRGADIGSGTVGGALAATLAVWLGLQAGWVWVLTGAVVLVLAGMASISALYREHGDAGWIVVDEAAGAFISLIGITALPAAFAAFAVFRAADIAKRYFPGVAAAERITGPTGVMADDVVAGLYGLVAGHIVQWLV